MIQPSTDGKQTEIYFSQVTAEVLNGKSNCGFGYVPTKVQKATVNESDAALEGGENEEFYIAPFGFTAERDSIAIEYNNRSYISDRSSVKKSGDKEFVALR